MAAERSRKHVLLVTCPAFGHIIPMLELGKKMVQFHDISLAVSAHKISSIRDRGLMSVGNSGFIRLVPVQDGFNPGSYQGTTHSSFITMAYLCAAGVKKFIESLPSRGVKSWNEPLERCDDIHPVDVIIVDSYLAGAVVACTEKGIPFYHLITYSAGCAKLFLTLQENSPFTPDALSSSFPAIIKLPDSDLSPPVIVEWRHKLLTSANSTYCSTSGLIFNTVRAIEEEALQEIENHFSTSKMPLFVIGPIISYQEEQMKTRTTISDWLDSKEKKSVIYISFGSEAWLRPVQIREISSALLKINQPFIWSIPKAHQIHLPEEMRDQAENNLKDRNSLFLLLKWAPQKLILEHCSTSVFLSHCGWNSTLEALTSGVPVVGWPMFSDQLLNSDFLERKGVSIRLRNTGMNPNARVVPSEEILNAIKTISGRQEGTEVFGKVATRISEAMKKAVEEDGSSRKDFLKLMKF